MKSTLLTLILLVSHFIIAQDKLIVEYESYIEMDNSLIDENNTITGDYKINAAKKQEIEKAMKEALSKPSYYKLILNSTESTFTYQEKIQNDQPKEGIKIQFMVGGSGSTYKNLNEQLMIEESKSFNKEFLITDSLKQFDWKITRDKKEILGFEVRKATAKVGDNIVTAWYAPKLTYKNGPDKFWGLPGLILEIEEEITFNKNTEKQIYRAVKVEVDNNVEIKKPTKGKKITQQEFHDFTKEQSQKMKEMYGGGVDKD